MEDKKQPKHYLIDNMDDKKQPKHYLIDNMEEKKTTVPMSVYWLCRGHHYERFTITANELVNADVISVSQMTTNMFCLS